MDYPFFFKQIASIPTNLVTEYVNSISPSDYGSSPYFKDDLTQGVSQIATHSTGNRFIKETAWPTIRTTFPNVASIKWYEINVIQPGGVLKEHADFESRAFDTHEGSMYEPYKALEVVLCHKIHIHLQGASKLLFRRSRHDAFAEFEPVVGGVYLFNNYVLHKSVCVGDVPRMAMTLVIKDEGWQAKRALLNRFGYPHYNAYDGLNTGK